MGLRRSNSPRHQWVNYHHCISNFAFDFAFDFAKRSSKKKRVYPQIRIGRERERKTHTQLYINKAQAPLATHKEMKINAGEWRNEGKERPTKNRWHDQKKEKRKYKKKTARGEFIGFAMQTPLLLPLSTQCTWLTVSPFTFSFSYALTRPASARGIFFLFFDSSGFAFRR